MHCNVVCCVFKWGIMVVDDFETYSSCDNVSVYSITDSKGQIIRILNTEGVCIAKILKKWIKNCCKKSCFMTESGHVIGLVCMSVSTLLSF